MNTLSTLTHAELLHQADANNIDIKRIQQVEAISQLNLHVDSDWNNQEIDDFISNPFNPFNHKKTTYKLAKDQSAEQFILQIDPHSGYTVSQINIQKQADLSKFWNVLAKTIEAKINTKKIRHYFIDESGVLCYIKGTLFEWHQMFNQYYEDEYDSAKQLSDDALQQEILNLDNDDCNIITGHIINDDWDTDITIADASQKENIEISDTQQNVLNELSPKNQQIIMDYIAKTSQQGN